MAYDLKSESEVKDYIQNLGIEYRFGCYSEKKADACHLLGDYLEAVKKDYEKASKVFKNNCDDHNYGKSCHKYGNFMLVGRGHDRENFPEAYKYFDKACSLNEVDSCLNQGLMLVTNNKMTGVAKDVVKGMAVLDKACMGNNGTACYYLSGMYIAGVKKEGNGEKTARKAPAPSKDSKSQFLIEKDMSKAYRYTLQGCTLGNMYSCANLSQMYMKGDGTEKNMELAEKYKKMALDMQDEVVNSKNTLTFQEGLAS